MKRKPNKRLGYYSEVAYCLCKQLRLHQIPPTRDFNKARTFEVVDI